MLEFRTNFVFILKQFIIALFQNYDSPADAGRTVFKHGITFQKGTNIGLKLKIIPGP